MRVKARVMELLRAADRSGLEALVASDPASLRVLLGRLWDPDQEVREHAAAALGAAAVVHEDLVRDIARRLMWALNDESATNGVYGIVALGEIGARNPQLIAPFVEPLASFAWDDGLRLEILRALARIADAAPEVVAGCRQILEPEVCMNQTEERQLLDRIAAPEEAG
jgi:hypothetical protein